MSDTSAPATHDETHEVRILEAAFDERTSDGTVAKQIATCEHCLSYAFAVIDDVMALRVRGKRPLRARSVDRLDAILSDAMLLMADAASSTGDETEKADRGRKVPAGGA